MPNDSRESHDHRVHPRVHVQVAVTLMSESQLYTGLSENLSEGGVFVATHVPRRVGERVDLTLTLKDGAPIHMVAEVRWVRPVSDRIESPAGMGLRFIALKEEDAKAIRAFLRERDPLLFDD